MIRNLKFGLLTLVLAGGCAQILGISEYEVDPSLDAGGEGGEGTASGGSGQEGGSGGSTTQGGEPTTGGGNEGGEPPVVGGGAPGAGGEGGAPPLGAPIDCDSADCCSTEGGTPVGVELLLDGGFELGTVADGLTPWVESSSQGFAIISLVVPEDGWFAREGDYFVYLAGFPLESSALYSENVTVPSGAGWMVVSGYRWFQIDTQTDTNTDFAAVSLYSLEDLDDDGLDDIVEVPLFWGNSTLSTLGWGDVATWTRFEAEWSAAPHQGGVRYLGLAGIADDYSDDPDTDSSSYLFDEISLKAFRCYE